jgi:hypothetical protein
MAINASTRMTNMILMLESSRSNAAKSAKHPGEKTEVSFRLKTSELAPARGAPYPAPEFRVLRLYGLRVLSSPSRFKRLVIARGVRRSAAKPTHRNIKAVDLAEVVEVAKIGAWMDHFMGRAS